MTRRILFVCVENACRSQMAEGWARYLGQGRIEVWSAGSRPAGQVAPQAIEVMRECGIDIAQQRSKGFDALPEVTWDLVITMGCGDECPWIPARLRLEWDIPDPKGQTLEAFRRVRDEIARRVRALLASLEETVERTTDHA